MCERYTIIAKAEDFKNRFNVIVPNSYKSRYNAAPTQILPVITNESPEGLSFFYWGIIPNWSKNNNISKKLINAESETLGQKASFKSALQKRRCLIPANGFYEWKAVGKKTRVPHYISLANDELFAFAGLWDEFEDNNEETVHTFTIVTTESNSSLAQIHNRMPAILEKKNESKWLDNSLTQQEHLDLLKPYPSAGIKVYTVSPQVNDLKNDDPSLIKKAPPADQFGNYTLFD